jgi:hypothetical protein
VERQNVALAGVFLPRLSLKSEVFIFAHWEIDYAALILTLDSMPGQLVRLATRKS